jgi:hypothetical protein
MQRIREVEEVRGKKSERHGSEMKGAKELKLKSPTIRPMQPRTSPREEARIYKRSR